MKIKVVVCEPNQYARVEEIENDLSDLQRIVNGYIEVYAPFDECVVIICNEDGKINGSLPCRKVFDANGELRDIVFGSFFICGIDDDGDFISLTDEQAKKYKKLFDEPNV